jgi:hypothetical protein
MPWPVAPIDEFMGVCIPEIERVCSAPSDLSWDVQIILHRALVLVVAVPSHSLAQGSAKANAASGFLPSSPVIPGVCDAINLVDL